MSRDQDTRSICYLQPEDFVLFCDDFSFQGNVIHALDDRHYWSYHILFLSRKGTLDLLSNFLSSDSFNTFWTVDGYGFKSRKARR